MTPDELLERVAALRKKAEGGDDEMCHVEEDSILTDTLKAIAGGSRFPIDLATIALTTEDIKFSRWYA